MSSGSVRFEPKGSAPWFSLPSPEASDDIACRHFCTIQQGTDKAHAQSTLTLNPPKYRAHPVTTNTVGGAAACSWTESTGHPAASQSLHHGTNPAKRLQNPARPSDSWPKGSACYVTDVSDRAANFCTLQRCRGE